MKLRFNKENTKFKVFYFFIGLVVLLFSNSLFAGKAIVIAPNTVISSPTTYSNDTLDMSNGSFIVNNNASLTIDHCTINGTISTTNPVLIHVSMGDLILTSNMINITSSGLPPVPTHQALYQVIKVDQGTVNLTGNVSSVDTNNTVGFLLTNKFFTTDGFTINNNTFKNFHGGLYLIHSSHAEINNNSFRNVSFGNILNIGSMNNIRRNRFVFSGFFASGDAIDVFSSDQINVTDNHIESPSCYGVFVLSSQNVLIQNNKINDGLTYGISVRDDLSLKNAKGNDKFLYQMLQEYKTKPMLTSNISVIDNYISQNRYGLHAINVDNLIIQDNIFIQHFEDNATRKFWTDNTNLLLGVTNLTWTDNLYKEAFTQVNKGDNSKSKQVLTFPVTGGVILP